MTPDNVSARRSPLSAAFGAALALATIVGWVQSDEPWLLAAALALAAFSPAWYLIPLSFTAPISEQLRRPSGDLPRWAQALIVIGMFFGIVAVGLRLAA